MSQCKTNYRMKKMKMMIERQCSIKLVTSKHEETVIRSPKSGEEIREV